MPIAPDSRARVLVAGAGPTGLSLGAQLQRCGVPFRIIDRAPSAAVESRALGVQARTLEVLDSIGLADRLVERGVPVTRLAIHFDGSPTASLDLANLAPDTAFQFILLISQADTESLLTEHLAGRGATIERGVTLTALATHERGVIATLTHHDGTTSTADFDYVVGCDGAHSIVRRLAGLPFEGSAYPQEFLLGDLEIDADRNLGLDAASVHAFPGRDSIGLFFRLGHPSTWRVIAIPSTPRAVEGDDETLSTHNLPLVDLQRAVDDATGGGMRLRDPSWLSRFHLHHRQAASYRAGRFFLAGDAAHIHSPIGAQGMNTGMQDAWNLGWKLALVLRGEAKAELLDTYHEERWPVGHALLRSTDRAFAAISESVSGGGVATWVRKHVLPLVVPLATRPRRLRAAGFRAISELDVHYRERSLSVGPRSGERLPDREVQRALVGARLTVALIGAGDAWKSKSAEVAALAARFAPMVEIRHADSVLDFDAPSQLVVRPDGYLGYTCAGTDLRGVADYFGRWLSV